MKIPASDALLRFNHIVGEINSAYHEAALHFGFSDSEFQIIYTLSCEGGRCLLGDICAYSGMSKQTVNSALRKLEREGILTLENYDGKKKTAVFTERGKALADATAAKIIAEENRIYDCWGKENTELYLNLARNYLEEFLLAVKEMGKTK